MLWDFNIIPNELDYGYLMLPPGVLHMSALGRFGRFTLFSPRVSHSNTCRFLSFVCFVCLFVALLCFWFLFCKCLGIPNSPRSLDLDDRQGLIARSAMQQKKDAFSLDKKRPLKVDAASALRIPVKEMSDLLVVSQDRANRFELTPVWAPVEPPTKRAKTAEVRLSSASDVPMPPKKDDTEKGSSDEEDSDSSGSNSDVSSQDDSSDVSDLEKFDEAYTDFSALTNGVDPQTLERDGSGHPNDEVPGIDLPGGMKALHSLANVPKCWPQAPGETTGRVLQ